MLKHIKLFESYLMEAQIEVTTTKTIKLNKGIEEKIKLAAKMSEELSKLTEEYKKKIAPMQDVLDKYDKEILESLQTVNVNQVKVEDTIAKVMMTKGKLTDSYKTLWDAALDKVNAATKKTLLELQAANKKQNPDKYWMEYVQESAMTNEGLKDIKEWGTKLVDKIKTWAKDVWAKLKNVFEEYDDSVQEFEKVANKITK